MGKNSLKKGIIKGIRCTPNLIAAMEGAKELAMNSRSKFITPEHFCRALFAQKQFCCLMAANDNDPKASRKKIDDYLSMNLKDSQAKDENPSLSDKMAGALKIALDTVVKSGTGVADVPHVIFGILNQIDCYAREWLTVSTSLNEIGLLNEVFRFYSDDEGEETKEDIVLKQKYCKIMEPYRNLVGRDDVVSRALMAMCLSERNNPLLVGPSGTGKTVLTGAIAARIADGGAPDCLKGRGVYCLDMKMLQEESSCRSEIEENVSSLLNQLESNGHSVVVIENIHEIIGCTSLGPDLLDLFRPYLDRRDIAFLCTTTTESYKKIEGRDASIWRLFRRIDVPEPSDAEVLKILEMECPMYEDVHGIKFGEGVLEHIVKCCRSNVSSLCLPQKAFDLMDVAGACMETYHSGVNTLDSTVVDEAVAKMGGVLPIQPSEVSFSGLKERLRSRIFGQEKAVDAVCDAVYCSAAGLSDPRKPKASLLFVGPTGTGKTQLVNELGEALGMPVQRFDMSEYSERYTISRLLGAPAGYVGYDEGGLLTDAVRRTPSCILLLDEIEKAHSDIYNILLQIMDYGTATDARGQKTDFRNAILIMTSNAGARYASQSPVGFGRTADAGEAMCKELKNIFTPELLGRLTSTVVFNDMTRDVASLILNAKINEFASRLKAKSVDMACTDAAREFLLDMGYSKEQGARRIENAVLNNLRPLLVNEILFGSLKDGGKVTVDVLDGSLTLEKTA